MMNACLIALLWISAKKIESNYAEISSLHNPPKTKATRFPIDQRLSTLAYLPKLLLEQKLTSETSSDRRKMLLSEQQSIPPPPPQKLSSTPTSQPSSTSTSQPSSPSQNSIHPPPPPPKTQTSVFYKTLFAAKGHNFENYGHKTITDPINNLIVITTLAVSGRVFIYTSESDSNGYELISELSSPKSTLDNFGSTVAISNNSLLVGAPNDNSVYFYSPDETGNFVLQQRIQPNDVITGSNFGCSLDVYNDYAIIGASGDSTVSYSSGAAYIYKKDSDGLWKLSSKLVPRTPLYKFGVVVHLRITHGLITIMVSADGVVSTYRATIPDITTSSSGNVTSDSSLPNAFSTKRSLRDAIIFERRIEEEINLSWDLESRIYPYEESRFTSFGYNVYSSSNHTFISSYAKDGSGQVGVYARDFESEGSVDHPNLILSANQSSPGDRFGHSITCSKKLMIIGAPAIKDGNGEVYLFNTSEVLLQSHEILEDRNFSKKVLKFHVVSNKNSESYGTSVAVIGETLFVGAELGFGITNFTGVVYIVKNLSQYSLNEYENKEDYDKVEYSKSGNGYESTTTRIIGILILIFIPILSISIFFLFCFNYNKMMCKTVTDAPEHNTYSATYEDESKLIDNQVVDVANTENHLVDTKLSLDLKSVQNVESSVLKTLKSIPKKFMGLFGHRQKTGGDKMAMEDSDQFEDESVGKSPMSANEESSVESSVLLTLKRINLM